jgi:hypothetical protein
MVFKKEKAPKARLERWFYGSVDGSPVKALAGLGAQFSPTHFSNAHPLLFFIHTYPVLKALLVSLLI